MRWDGASTQTPAAAWPTLQLTLVSQQQHLNDLPVSGLNRFTPQSTNVGAEWGTHTQ